MKNSTTEILKPPATAAMPSAATLQRWSMMLGGLVAALMFVNLYNIFMLVPTEKSMGLIQRIFYFHAPPLITSFIAFTVTFVYSILYLAKHRLWHDRIASCAAEVGVLLTTTGLITGPIWARPVWNTWWSWDPRLTTTLVLWFIYIGYLMLRAYAGDEQRGARFAAVFAIVGFVDVPIVYMANRLWRTLHPQPVILGSAGSDSGLEPTMRYAFIFSIVTFTLLFVFFLLLRLRVERARVEVDQLKRETAFS